MHAQAETGLAGDELADSMRAELQKQQQRIRGKLAQISGVDGAATCYPVQTGPGTKRRATVSGGVCNAARVAKCLGVSLTNGTQSASQGSCIRGMTNEQLAHEILLDPCFHLDDKVSVPSLCVMVVNPPTEPLLTLARPRVALQVNVSDEKLVHTKIRETFERAFWNSLADDLCAIPCSYSRVISVLDEVRKGVQVHCDSTDTLEVTCVCVSLMTMACTKTLQFLLRLRFACAESLPGSCRTPADPRRH